MRLTAKLVRVAAVIAAASAGTALAAGCGSSSSTGGDGGTVGCGGCMCGGGQPQTVTVTAAQACQILEESYSISQYASGETCRQLCTQGGFECELPQSYVTAAQSLNPDAGQLPTDGGGRPLDCPTSPATMTVTCIIQCTGRLTEGYCAPADAGEEGERLAAMAYLEAVSVHAFERLERELEAHGAPSTLLRASQRARRDEERHTSITALLARHRGALPRMPDGPSDASTSVRTLLEVALENAVEGCIRETYGAVQGLVEARTSPDATMRRAMESIAVDECRHAELAWAVHAWAMPRLTEDERSTVERAMKDAIAEIAARDPRAASLLFS